MTGNLLIQKGKEIFSILNFGIEVKPTLYLRILRPKRGTGIDKGQK